VHRTAGKNNEARMTTTNKHAGPISAGFRGSAFARTPIDDAERKAIIAALKSGQPAYQIGRERNRSESVIREVARAAGLIGPSSPKQRKAAAWQDVSLSLPGPTFKQLELAAQRRRMSSSALIAQILIGVLTRGSIDKPPTVDHAVELSLDYLKKRENHDCAERKLGRGIDMESALSVGGG
jgi:hypothetical protein